MSGFSEWVRAHSLLLIIISAVTLLLSVVLMPFVLVRMPTDYFLHKHATLRGGTIGHIVLLILKNVVGVIVLLVGVVLIITPGPGLIVFLLGLSLVNFPGKRRLELKIVRNPKIYKFISLVRARAGRPPLELPDPREAH